MAAAKPHRWNEPIVTQALAQLVESLSLESSQIAEGISSVSVDVLSQSSSIDGPNFTQILPADLELLFTSYDRAFFRGLISDTLHKTCLRWRVSRRMTSSGGKTTRFRDFSTGKTWYEICVSHVVLFGSFDGRDHREVTVSGLVCHNRLQALQRVMEHELIHLVELLVWGQTSCARARFRSMSRRLFGHTQNKHRLITPREKAMAQFGIRPGMAVHFCVQGKRHQGFVNRINKRATVLVEDRRGEKYSDGKRYTKFYVPVALLEPVESLTTT